MFIYLFGQITIAATWIGMYIASKQLRLPTEQKTYPNEDIQWRARIKAF